MVSQRTIEESTAFTRDKRKRIECECECNRNSLNKFEIGKISGVKQSRVERDEVRYYDNNNKWNPRKGKRLGPLGRSRRLCFQINKLKKKQTRNRKKIEEKKEKEQERREDRRLKTISARVTGRGDEFRQSRPGCWQFRATVISQSCLALSQQRLQERKGREGGSRTTTTTTFGPFIGASISSSSSSGLFDSLAPLILTHCTE